MSAVVPIREDVVVPDAPSPGADMSLTRRRLHGTRVLVTDDNEVTRRTIRRLLERMGAAVVEAANGHEALVRAAEQPFDAVLLDVEMPQLDGLSTCRALRADLRTARLPIVIVTTLSSRHHTRAIEAGADDFVSKPFDARVLVTRLGNIVSRHRAERANACLVEALSQYVSPATELQAKSRTPVEPVDAAILFSDLRGFTATSFDHDIEQVFRALNAVLARQSKVVRRRRGYVDKFSGDGMLAVFDGPDAAHDACMAASEILAWAQSSHGVPFWNPLPIAVGIHAGTVLRGDLGDECRRDFTVLGQVVNVAARLCGAAQALRCTVSGAVRERTEGRVAFGKARSVRLKGVPDNMEVYELATAEVDAISAHPTPLASMP